MYFDAAGDWVKRTVLNISSSVSNAFPSAMCVEAVCCSAEPFLCP